MPEKRLLEVGPGQSGARLDVWLSRMLPELSRSRLQKLIEAGAVRVGAAAAKSRYAVREGDRVEVTIPDPEPAAPQAQDIPVAILHEDDDLLVIDKPAGLVVHPGAGAREGTLVNALLARRDSLSSVGGVVRPGIVHRLDKDTSGLILVAKNDFTHLALCSALSRREISRVYWAIVLRAMPAQKGVVDAPIGRHPAARTKMAVRPDGRSARTSWQLLEPFRGFALVECRLATGRTHQIRVHMAHERHPVLGDELYGGGPTAATQLVGPQQPKLRMAVLAASRQMLHARELVFLHPRARREMRFVCEPPEDFLSLLSALREDARQAAAGSKMHGKPSPE